MKIITKLSKTQSENLLDFCFDVGKDRLFYYSETAGTGNSTECLEHNIANRNKPVIKELAALNQFALERGYDGIRIVCEPTGGFERRLLRLARKGGHHTAYVNPESVHKMQVVESNDAGKTDLKDPHTMFLLAKLGKVLTQRNLQGDWLVLREYNVRYERLEKDMVELKNRIYRILRHLFCELSFKKDWLFGGKAAEKAVRAYGLNPYRMLQCGPGNVRRRLKGLGVKNNTIKRLLEDARISVLQQIDESLIAFYEEDLRYEFESLKRTQKMMTETRAKMIAILEALTVCGEVNILPQKGLISPFMLARILGETGPMSDFSAIRQLYRYGGLNIRQRQSGTFKGQEKISKKGRPLLRKLLNQAIIARVTKKGLFGEYYHGKKKDGMIGPKAMVAVARKFLKMLFGLHKAGTEVQFDPMRVFQCYSQFHKAA